MPVAQEEAKEAKLVTSRKPVAAEGAVEGGKSVGTLAVDDALMLIGACWVAIIALWVSFRKVNV